jgi:hypothetical protein
MSDFCYWSVADGNHGRMMKTLIASARRHGVKEDFHVWTDTNLPDAHLHQLGKFNKDHYLFKLKFLKNQVSKLDYKYFVWLDADNYFVRHPGSFDELLRDNKWFIQLESDCTSKFITRPDWWGCPIRWYTNLLMPHFGVLTEKIYNCNAGFWIVRKEAIEEFYEKAITFFTYCREKLHLVNFTEEPPLALLGHFVDNIELNTFKATNHIWASDWIGHFKGVLPNGHEWRFKDYMSNETHNINPAIVHCMRSKEAMIRAYYINWRS